MYKFPFLHKPVYVIVHIGFLEHACMRLCCLWTPKLEFLREHLIDKICRTCLHLFSDKKDSVSQYTSLKKYSYVLASF
jgi:hypothetical protein